jgi:hypothetical protein
MQPKINIKLHNQNEDMGNMTLQFQLNQKLTQMEATHQHDKRPLQPYC